MIEFRSTDVICIVGISELIGGGFLPLDPNFGIGSKLSRPLSRWTCRPSIWRDKKTPDGKSLLFSAGRARRESLENRQASDI